MGKAVIIWCDGACRNNQGDGAIGAIGIVLQFGRNILEINCAFQNVTNQQMEIKAMTTALEAIKKKDVEITVKSDSAYVLNCLKNRWFIKWRQNDWTKSNGDPVKNKELWINLLKQYESFSNIILEKVKGHSGERGNERADKLANIAMDEKQFVLTKCRKIESYQTI
jgi:ribonuclease HI